ncbi:MAG TPA: decarboxylating NADP(+)-dependent phosphogluconate dehydrogenase, partial [Trueperaceae bacterium]
MVPAGDPVDAVLHDLLPYLEPGDVVIDGGNSHYIDTARRQAETSARGILYVGAGVSGGEYGARHGPSIMPGGNPEAWPLVRELLQDIAAKVDGEPCCEWVGPGGAGHYVKMVHNGIEYGDMQLIAEAYHYMRSVLGMRVDEASDVFAEWDRGRLDSFLIEITAQVLRTSDDDGAPLVEKVVDIARQKGTGRWAVADALERSVPLTLVGEAVFARSLSELKAEREAAADVLRGPGSAGGSFDRQGQLADLEEALYASKIVSYAQGFLLMAAAANQLDWPLDLAAVAQTWRGGCIIRSRFLTDIRAAYVAEPQLANLLTTPFFARELASCQAGWRRTLTRAIGSGIPMPAMSAALAFYDGYRTKRLPANLIQALRDRFGAHGYERLDAGAGELFHSEWYG